MPNEVREAIGVNALLELQGSAREAKSYAFLYATFKRSEGSENPTRDAVDCLAPFIAPYLNTIEGKQVTTEGIKSNLKDTFGFDIPHYAIEQLLPALARSGFVAYNKNVKAYFAQKQKSEFDVAKSEIETDFDEVVEAFAEFAKRFEIDNPPFSSDWGEALLLFLRGRSTEGEAKFFKMRNAIVDSESIEKAFVGSFLKQLKMTSSKSFDKVLKIFMGVLVEEFISSVAEIGVTDTNVPSFVLYDTSVLLRLLGCSGKLLKTATEELNRYLQDIGFQVYYFSGNEQEVAGILDAIVSRKDSGLELEGETAAAITDGEISMSEIRLLQGTFPEQLAAMNVFSADSLEPKAVANAKFQIDEKGFQEYLKRQSIKAHRRYGIQNIENDAGYLAAVMRMRGATLTRDLCSCRYLFVTTNKFLARTSRQYLIEQQAIKRQHCPPILSVGQVATIAWLVKDQRLDPMKAGRELMTYCFAAVRPDHDWFKNFREGLEKLGKSVDTYESDSQGRMVLQAARRIAQEESFGQPAIVRELSMVEILARAQEVVATDKAEEVRVANLAGREDARQENWGKAKKRADKVIYTLKWLVFIAFIVATVNAGLEQVTPQPDRLSLWVVGLIGLLNVVQVFRLFGLKLLVRFENRLRDNIARFWIL